MSPTVLVVDDHASFRAAAGALLRAEGFTVVGEAADGPTALAQAVERRPQLVLLDVQLPGQDGFAVAELLAALPAAPVVLLVSSRRAGDYGDRVARSAARGFVEKRDLSGPELQRYLQ